MAGYIYSRRSKPDPKSQVSQVLRYMRLHGSIDPLRALRHCGCFRLSERIRELEAMGFNILHTTRTREPRHAIYHLIGTGKRKLK